MPPATIDERKLEHLVHPIVGDLGATLNAALVRSGDKLGLCRALAGAGPITPAEPPAASAASSSASASTGCCRCTPTWRRRSGKA
jgi:hypothetical protein